MASKRKRSSTDRRSVSVGEIPWPNAHLFSAYAVQGRESINADAFVTVVCRHSGCNQSFTQGGLGTRESKRNDDERLVPTHAVGKGVSDTPVRAKLPSVLGTVRAFRPGAKVVGLGARGSERRPSKRAVAVQ